MVQVVNRSPNMPLIIPIQIALQEVASGPTAGKGIFKQWSLRFNFSNKRAEGKHLSI